MPRKCAVERAYDTMSPADKNIFYEAVCNPNLSAGLIAKALRMEGHHDVDRAAVGHYRRKLAADKVSFESD